MKNKNGFTLIELMIVILIIGILAAIAYPSYQGAIRDSRRGVAEADLVKLAGIMERDYTTNSKYRVATPGFFFESPQEGTSKYYDLLPPVISASGARFSLSAVPKGAQASDYCGTLTLDSSNTTSAADASCW